MEEQTKHSLYTISIGRFKIRPVGIQDFLLITAVFSLCAVQLFSFASDPGLGWHLKAGEYFLQNGSLPAVDFLSAHTEGKTWLLDQWLADVIIAALFKIGGWVFLYLVFVLIYLATYFLIVYPRLLSYGHSAVLASLVTLIAFKLGQIHFILRPVMFSFPFFAIIYFSGWHLWSAFKNETDPHWKVHAPICLLTFLIWANIHPTFVLGLVFLAMIIPAMFLEKLISRAGGATLSPLSVALLITACSAVTFLNPYFYNLHESILWLGRSDFALNFYSEWQSPDFRGDEGLYTLLPLLLLAGASYLSSEKNRMDAFTLLTLGFFFFMTVRAVRILPFWGIVASVPLIKAMYAASVSNIWQKKPFRLFGKSAARIELREQESYKGILSGILCTVLLLFFASQNRIFLYSGSFGPGADKFPYGVLEPLKKESESGKRIIVANHMAWGSFLNLYLPPNVKTLIDDRTSLHGDEFYYRFFKALRPDGNYQEYLKEMGADYLLLPADSAFSRVLSRHKVYPERYRDHQSVLYSVNSNG